MIPEYRRPANERPAILPDATIAWAEGEEPWSEMRKFTRYANWQDFGQVIVGSIAYTARFSGMTLAFLAVAAILLRALGLHVTPLPQWAWIAGAIGVALVVAFDARRHSSHSRLIFSLLLALSFLTTLLHIPWWLTWGALSLIFLFFGCTAMLGMLALLGRRRYDLGQRSS